jgi:hypothetical protein
MLVATASAGLPTVPHAAIAADNGCGLGPGPLDRTIRICMPARLLLQFPQR